MYARYLSLPLHRLLLGSLLAAAITSTAPPASAEPVADAACLGDSCQMCALGGTCFTQALAMCRHPACFLGGVIGGLVGALGGGMVGPLLLSIPGLVLYPGLDPAVALVGSIIVGAGLGCAALGIPGMVIGEAAGQATTGACWPWSWTEPAARRQRMSPTHRR
ncbi:MAG: hypothetical protein JXR83_22780 [Deltaproteobacteria bacterium]|nr:hypothetical protein [Deltaproteobacteria bacterium]